MDIFYLGILIFLIVLATFDLSVGVANDAVNFMSPAVGAKAAKFRTILLVAAIGIFMGAIWANVSWGTYWSWDSKETWALITFMLYAAAIHTESLPALNRPRNYHLYLVLAFLSIIMTYFGVNYFLTGMHSYA